MPLGPPHGRRPPVSDDSATTWFGGVGVELFRSAPNLRLAEHGHHLVHYCLPVSGHFYESEGKSETLLMPGGMRSSPPGDRHEIRFGPQVAECLVVLESPDPDEGVRLAQVGRRFLRLREGPRIARELLQELRDPDLISQLVVEQAVLELRAQACRPERAVDPPPAWLREVRAKLDASIGAPRSLTELAASVRVHRSQLVRAFRSHFGCSVGQYLRRRRLAAAVRRITTSDAPLATVATDCGFSDQSHLTRQVKAFTGLPPARLRQRLHRESPRAKKLL